VVLVASIRDLVSKSLKTIFGQLMCNPIVLKKIPNNFKNIFLNPHQQYKSKILM
jgi:hypothetical protein